MKKIFSIFCLIISYSVVLHADPVIDLINKVKAYEAKTPVYFESTETYEYGSDHKTMSKQYAVLKKGDNQVVQDKSNNQVSVKKGKKEKVLVAYSIAEGTSIPSILDSFLESYQSENFEAKISAKDETYVIKANRNGIEFKMVFAKSPVVLLSYESKDKADKVLSEGQFSYDFDKGFARLTQSEEKGWIMQNDKPVIPFKKTVVYSQYKTVDSVSEDDFDDDVVKRQVFKKPKD